MTPNPPDPAHARTGVLYGAAAYVLWGLLPGYFLALRPAGPWEILGHRILWSLAVCLVLLSARHRLAWLRDLFRAPGQLAASAIAGALIAVNWLTYLVAVTTGRITEGALGYFLTPLVSIALGMVLLGERLRRLQAVAATVGLAGAAYLAFAAQTPSWIAATLACSFGLYGLVKKRVRLGPVLGLTVETAVLAPAAAFLLWLAPAGTTFGHHGWSHAALLAGMGVITMVPLLLFAVAARRVTLVVVGLLQFIAPVLQFFYGLAVGEPVSAHRWVGFAIVWVALCILVVDMLSPSRAPSPGAPAQPAT